MIKLLKSETTSENFVICFILQMILSTEYKMYIYIFICFNICNVHDYTKFQTVDVRK